jgi:hypothetical protein
MAAWVNKWLLVLGFPLSFFTSNNLQTAVRSPMTEDRRPLTQAELPLQAEFTGVRTKPRTSDFGLCTVHPFHVSTIEINHNPADRTLEISCRIFTDDFETALNKQFNTKADFSDQRLKQNMDSLVRKYVVNRLQLKADGKAVTMSYLGFEKESEAVYAYLQVDNIAAVKKLEAVNSIMHNIFDDQINIMHVVVGGKRKSIKLYYPATQAAFDF